MIIVKVDQATKDLIRQFEYLSSKQTAKATSMAINKTILKGRTEARTAVKKVWNIPQRYLYRINVIRSKPNYLVGKIFASSKPIPADAFSPRFDLVSGGAVRGRQIISKRGIVKTQLTSGKQRVGVSLEVKKGKRITIPYAFLLPTGKARVFARGEYRGGDGSWGFIQRHTRQENSTGNDAVKPMVSVTVFGAVINPIVKQSVAHIVKIDYEKYMINALKYQAAQMR